MAFLCIVHKENLETRQTTPQLPKGINRLEAVGYSGLIFLLGVFLIGGLWLFVRSQINYDYDRTIADAYQETMEDEIKRHQDAIGNAQRMASLGVMAGSIAHEINQPLNSIKISASGLLYLMEQGTTLSTEDYQRELEDTDSPEKTIQIDLQVADQVIISVADNGPGVEQSTLDKIFDLFYKTGRTTENMGLGLAIVQSIMYAHGGEIIAETNQAGGATFRLSFPLLDGFSTKEETV